MFVIENSIVDKVIMGLNNRGSDNLFGPDNFYGISDLVLHIRPLSISSMIWELKNSLTISIEKLTETFILISDSH